MGEFDSSGHFTAAFGWGASGLMQRYLPSSSTYTFYAFDPQGTVVNRYRSQDPPGQFYDTSIYGDFGHLYTNSLYSPLFAGQQTVPYDEIGYCGQWGCYTDAYVGLVQMGYRVYTPEDARFVTRDPLGHEAGLNLYTYCNNNPVNYIDPMGLTEGWDLIFLAWDVYNVAADHITHAPLSVKVLDGTALGIDAGLTLIPGAPAGPGHFVTAGAKATILARHAAPLAIPLAVRGAQAVYHTARATAPLVHMMAKKPSYPHDAPNAHTNNWSGMFKSEGEARQLAREKLGKNPVKISPNKWRSSNGKWQYRAKSGDVGEHHIHLEELDPKTGRVIQNLHLRWRPKNSR